MYVLLNMVAIHFVSEQTCPGSDVLGGSRRRQLLSQHNTSENLLHSSSLRSITHSRRHLLGQDNYPNYPASADVAITILAAQAAMSVIFAVAHWMVNQNSFAVSSTNPSLT